MDVTYQISTEQIIERLRHLGYQMTDSDLSLIGYILSDCVRYVSNLCNITEIPVALNNAIIDLVVGKFLKGKIATGVKVNDLIDFSSCGISSITEGDVTVSYNSSDPNSLVNLFMAEIDKMCNKDREFLRFRRLCW